MLILSRAKEVSWLNWQASYSKVSMKGRKGERENGRMGEWEKFDSV